MKASALQIFNSLLGFGDESIIRRAMMRLEARKRHHSEWPTLLVVEGERRGKRGPRPKAYRLDREVCRYAELGFLLMELRCYPAGVEMEVDVARFQRHLVDNCGFDAAAVDDGIDYLGEREYLQLQTQRGALSGTLAPLDRTSNEKEFLELLASEYREQLGLKGGSVNSSYYETFRAASRRLQHRNPK
jgi:hypothetical protein